MGHYIATRKEHPGRVGGGGGVDVSGSLPPVGTGLKLRSRHAATCDGRNEGGKGLIREGGNH